MKVVVGNTPFTPQRIFCIGRNYADHVKEMKSSLPVSPVIFCKPHTSLVSPGEKIRFPKHGKQLHHEVFLVILIGIRGAAESKEDALSFIAGVTIGLDLTLRDIQNDLKSKGQPWEKSKAFDGSAPIGDFISLDQIPKLDDIEFSCHVNDEIRQKGNTGDMIFPVEVLIVELSDIWKLLPGDLIYTGTPSGVGPLNPGDTVTIESKSIGSFSWEVV